MQEAGLERAREIDLRFEGVTGFGVVGCNQVRVLRLGGNQIQDLLPVGLDKLIEVDISDNKLSTISPDLPASLKSLNASHNQLTTFRSKSPGLQILDLSHNQLTTFAPESPCLRVLNLARNRLEKLVTDGCLECLDVSGNCMIELALGYFLRRVYCQDNRLRRL